MPAPASVDAGPEVLPSANLFVAKYSPDRQVQWVRAGIGRGDWFCQLAVDLSGAVMLSSLAIETISFDAVTVTGPGEFVVKFDRNGTPLWTLEPGNGLKTAAMDKEGNVFLAYSDRENQKLLLTKFGPDGSAVWTREAQANCYAIWHTIAVDSAGNCFGGGPFRAVSGAVPGDTAIELSAITFKTRLF